MAVEVIMGKYDALFQDDAPSEAPRQGKYASLFDEEPVAVAPEPTKIPTGSTRSFDEPTPSLRDALYPREAALPDGTSPGRAEAAHIGDVGSLAGRLVTALVKTGVKDINDIDLDEESKLTLKERFGRDWGEFKKELAKKAATQGGIGGFIEDVIRDPATFFTGGIATAPVKGVVKNIAAGAVEGATSAAAHQLENVAAGKKVDLGAAALETAFGAGTRGGASAVGAGLRKLTGNSAAKSAKSIVSGLTDIPEDILERASNPTEMEAIKKAVVASGGGLTTLGDDVTTMINDIRAKAQSEIDAGIMAARPGGAITPTEATGYSAGERIADAAEGAKKRIGERFGAAQDIALETSGAGKRPLPNAPVEGALQPAGMIPKSVLQDKVDEVLIEIGYDATKGFTGLEKSGNRAIGRKAIDALNNARGMFGNAKTTEDALNMRRQIQKEISFGGPDGRPLFPKGSDEDAVMKKLYGKINDVVESQIQAQADELGIPQDIVGLWKVNNESWKAARDALESIQGKVRIGKTGTEEYAKSIKKIGINKLKEISELASKDSEMLPVWQEIQSGYFDNLINRSLKEGSIDLTSFKKAWSATEPELKQVMLGADKVRLVDDAIKSIDKYGVDEVKKIGTKVTGTGGSSTVTNLENIGEKSKRQALKELVFLEDITGVPEADRLSKSAVDFFAGKKLNLTSEGLLRLLSGSRTGKFLAGGAAGAATGRTVGEKLLGTAGGAVGGVLGGVLGVFAQSPSGGLAAYKAVNKLYGVAGNKGVRRAGAAVGKAVAGPQARQAARTGLFGYDYEE